jgi:hypothetical protein
MTVYGFGRGIQVSGSGGEGIAEGEEGGFGVELGVEGERALGDAVFAAGKVLEPGVAVGPEINRECVHTM